MRLSYDLHIHSCLSPCGDDDMLPSNIVGMAAVKELDVIALTDHNSCKNCPAAMKLAEAYGVLALPGMELTTSEEVHVVCLFPELSQAMAFDEYVYSRLIPFPNNPEVFGKQQIMDEDDREIGIEPNLLINASTIDFDEVYPLVTKYGGIMIPAHLDKKTTSLISNLGFIPPDSQFVCAEVKHTTMIEPLLSQHEYLQGCHIVSNSDAHYLEHIHEPVHFIECEEKSAAAVIAALQKK